MYWIYALVININCNSFEANWIILTTLTKLYQVSNALMYLLHVPGFPCDHIAMFTKNVSQKYLQNQLLPFVQILFSVIICFCKLQEPISSYFFQFIIYTDRLIIQLHSGFFSLYKTLFYIKYF
jgi:hypothetical protein